MSTLRANSIEHTNSGPITLTKQSASKAWSHTDYTTTTTRDAFNVSSLTDVSTGRTQHNFTNSMINSNYSGQFTLRNNVNQWWVSDYSTTSCTTRTYTGSSYTDQHHKLAVFGDLA